jgi:hypothetical protein
LENLRRFLAKYNYATEEQYHSGPTTRASDAAGAARNLGATFRRRSLPPARALTTAASSAADADVGRLITARFMVTHWNRTGNLIYERSCYTELSDLVILRSATPTMKAFPTPLRKKQVFALVLVACMIILSCAGGTIAVHNRFIAAPIGSVSLGPLKLVTVATQNPACSPFLPCRIAGRNNLNVHAVTYFVAWVYVPTNDTNLVQYEHMLFMIPLRP